MVGAARAGRVVGEGKERADCLEAPDFLAGARPASLPVTGPEVFRMSRRFRSSRATHLDTPYRPCPRAAVKCVTLQL